MICIGPLCIPVWQLLAFVVFLFTTLFRFLKGQRGAALPGQDSQIQLLEGPFGKDIIAKQQSKGQISPEATATSRDDVRETLKKAERLYSFLSDDKDRYVLVKLGAQWCGPCKHIKPYVEKLRYCYQFILIDIDVDDADPDLVEDAFALPTFRLYRWVAKASPDFSSLAQIAQTTGAHKVNLETMLLQHCEKFKFEIPQGHKLGGGETASSSATSNAANNNKQD